MAHFNSESKAPLNSDHNRETVAIKQMDVIPDLSITSKNHFTKFPLTRAHSNGYIAGSS